jgi:hypothetical protein
MAPWPKTVGGKPHHYRLSPANGGGRRLRHPYYDPIVYPRLPDVTVNFLDDVVQRTRAVVTKTIDSAAVDHFQDPKDATIITETWGLQKNSNELSTLTRFFRALLRYRTDTLPVGQYIGWCPRDISPKNFFVQLVDVRLGTTEDYQREEWGDQRDYFMQQTLSLSFKLVRPDQGPAGVVQFLGA